MLREALYGLAGFLGLVYCIEWAFRQFDDPREPPYIQPTIPVIGHLLGIFRNGYEYYDSIIRKTNSQIYSIGILNFKVYLTHDTRLSNLIAKDNHVSLRPFLADATKTYGRVSKEGHAVFDKLADEFSERTIHALAPGPHLDDQNLRMGDQSVIEISETLANGDDGTQLFQWSISTIIRATGASLFGVEHPFRDQDLVDAMWTWDEYRPGHTFGVDLFGTGYQARDKIIDAFREYFKDMPDDASHVIRERQRVMREGGIGEEDMCRIQSTLSNAYFNTIPTLFWTVYEVFSRPQLLEDIRNEIFSKGVQKSDDGSEFVLDIAALQTRCYILFSAMQETQRTRHGHINIRRILEDTVIDGQYLLKKGNMLHLLAKPVHHDPNIWGPEVNQFDPYRFVPTETGRMKKKKIQPHNFLPWGAAPWLCPARQFAATEIMIVVALLALRTNISPANGEGWKQPAVKATEISTLAHPKNDIAVKFTPRKEGAGKWRVTLGNSKARIALTSG